MVTTTILYQDDFEKSQLWFIANIIRDRSMTVEEMLRIAGVSMDGFAAEMGWDGYRPEQILTIDGSDIDDLERGDIVPTAFFIFKTPNGDRCIEIPKVSGMWESLQIVDSRLYDVLTEDDWIETTDCRPVMPMYSPEDMIQRYYAVIRGPKDRETVVGKFPEDSQGFKDCRERAEEIYNHMSKYEKKVENVLTCLIEEDTLNPNEDIIDFYSLNGVDIIECTGNPTNTPCRWGVCNAKTGQVLSWGVGDDEKAIFSTKSEAAEFLNSCDDIERDDYCIEKVI